MNTIELTIDHKIGVITFNRPEAMNALNATMASELLHSIKKLNSSSDVDVIILRGAGSLFMAGGDVGFFYKNIENLHEHVDNIIDTVHEFIHEIVNSPKPVIACVHGSVAGIGLSFMLACDLVMAAEGTKFTTAYSNIGTTPDGGCTYFLPRVVGVTKAKEMIMLSTLLDVEQATALGLINFVVPANHLFDEAKRLAEKLVHGPKLVYAKAKQLINHSLEHDLSNQLNFEKENFIKSTKTKDFKTGVSSFINKQKPEFEGV